MLKEGEGIIQKKYLFLIIVAIILIICYFIVRPYFVALVSAFILAYLVKPIYEILRKRLGKNAAALLCVILIIIIILIPITFLFEKLFEQFIQSSHTNIISGLDNFLKNTPLLSGVDFSSLLEKLGSFLVSKTTSVLLYIPSLLLTILITIFGVFYILKNWDYLSNELKTYLPVEDKDKIAKEIGSATYNIVYGFTLVAIIEFIISALGFYFSGVQFFILLPALIAFFAFIPGLGPILVWAPTAIVYLATHNYGTAIGVIITGLILTLGMDYFIGPKIIGSKSKIHPLIMLIGILGGIAVFGIFGFIIGPLILVYSIKLLKRMVA